MHVNLIELHRPEVLSHKTVSLHAPLCVRNTWHLALTLFCALRSPGLVCSIEDTV